LDLLTGAAILYFISLPTTGGLHLTATAICIPLQKTLFLPRQHVSGKAITTGVSERVSEQ
jgi:hypothetical protein